MMWGAIRYAERPPDHDHPYGHGKMESLAAVIGSLSLILAGGALGSHSLRKIFFLEPTGTSESVPAGFTLIVLGATIAIKEGLFRWIHFRSTAIESNALQTDAWHHRSDALTSLSAAVGISVALIGGSAWAQAR